VLVFLFDDRSADMPSHSKAPVDRTFLSSFRRL
jgi:hypothetical protein